MCFFCLVYTLYFAHVNSFQSNEYGNLWSLYTCGISGTLFVMVIAKKIQSLPIISYCGRYSIIILCTHQMIIQFILLFIKRLARNDLYIVALLFLITLGIEIMLIPVFRKYLPYVTTQKDVIKIE